MMNLLEINQRIKQRPPFQMIERVTELVPNESALQPRYRPGRRRIR